MGRKIAGQFAPCSKLAKWSESSDFSGPSGQAHQPENPFATPLLLLFDRIGFSMNRPCISLLTDFGLQDSYVGQMKGAIAAINPEATVIDLSHAIAPQQVSQAAIMLADAVDAFPDGTIHVVVVDPGVGSARRAIAAEIGQQRFVCPDNGLLTLLLRRNHPQRVVQLDEPRWWRSAVSSTFHGRDIFAPVAAAWSLGHDILELGAALHEPLVTLPLPDCSSETTDDPDIATLRGEVLAVDHFGNLITNIRRSAVPAEAAEIQLQIGQYHLNGIVRCYADRPSGEPVALFGSSGRLEIAIVNGNAARQLQIAAGEPVIVRSRLPPSQSS